MDDNERRMPVPTGQHEMRPGTKVTVKSKAIVQTRISREPHLRLGPNDYCVEVVRGGTYYEGFVSQVQKGDAFQFVESTAKGRWFGALSDVRRLPGSRSFGGNGELVFQFDGLEILQAAPIIERRAALSAPKATVKPQLGYSGDVEDVEFKD